MKITEKIIEDIKNLRGADVRIFGQPTTLPTAVDDFTIDIIDVLNDLQEYEIELDDYTVYDKDSENNISLFDIICDNYCNGEVDADLIIDELENSGYLTTYNSKCDNSYNWCAPITNNFAFEIYKDLCGNGVYVRFMVHRFGDVRCNYTDAAVYYFNDEYEFLEILTNNNKDVDVDIEGVTYSININIFNDVYKVFNNKGDYMGVILPVDNIEDVIISIKNLI